MIQKVKETIDQYCMFDQGDTIVVALSGGPDSCALLSILSDLEKEYGLKIIVAHFNHGLRGGESDFEEEFCRNLAYHHQLRFESKKMASTTVPTGKSPEEYYRKERYLFLDSVSAEVGAKKIALGHHLSDQAETVLLNILRGSGMEGLNGILPVRESRYIRPLIDVSRFEIIQYLQSKGLEYCNDSSNKSSVFLRNRIRNELIPLLKEGFNPKIERGLARMARMVSRDHEYLDGVVGEVMSSGNIKIGNDIIVLSANYFDRLHVALRFRLVKALLEGMTPDGKGIYSHHIESVVALTKTGSTGKQISLPFGLTAVKQYDELLIKKGNNADKKDYQYSLSIPGTVDLKERSIIVTARQGRRDEIDFRQENTLFLDLDKIRGCLTLRNRRPGDWFEPLGTKGRQKIKKLFIDRKIPRPERNSIAVLVDELSVLWVENMHLCERVKISSETQKVLVVEMRKLN